MTVSHRERTFRSACTRMVRDSQIVRDFYITHTASVKQSTHDSAQAASDAVTLTGTPFNVIIGLPITP